MLEAGQDGPRAREAFDELTRRTTGSKAARQAAADDVCGWLRGVWGLRRPPGRREPDIEALAREVAGFLAAHLADPAAADTFCGLDVFVSFRFIL
jgi:hypothetical protein